MKKKMSEKRKKKTRSVTHDQLVAGLVKWFERYIREDEEYLNSLIVWMELNPHERALHLESLRQSIALGKKYLARFIELNVGLPPDAELIAPE